MIVARSRVEEPWNGIEVCFPSRKSPEAVAVKGNWFG